MPGMILPSDLAGVQPDDGIVAVDTETSGLHPDDGARVSIVSVAFRLEGELQVHAWPFDQGPVEGKDLGRSGRRKRQRSLFDEAEVADNLAWEQWHVMLTWLSQWRHIYHNAPFDLAMLLAGTRSYAGANFESCFAWDTKIGQWILDPLESTSLKPTAARLWGVEEQAEQEALKPYLGPKDDPRFDLVPWSVIGPYAAKDAELTYRLWEHQLERLDGEDSWAKAHIRLEMDISRVLTGMMRRGIGYDREAAQVACSDAQRQLELIAGRLPFRPTVNEARVWFYDKCGAVPHCVTDKKQEPSVGECCVRTLISQGIAGAEDWQRYQKLQSAISRYYEGAIERIGDDGRLRSDFQHTGTVNMRFSSRRFNLQALPHDYRFEVPGVDIVPPRSLFVPAKGRELYEMDLSQAELRRATKVAKCEAMQEAIATGDPHGQTARLLFDVTPSHADWFKYRQVSKRCNFGLLYNIGPDTFAADLEKQTGVVMSRDQTKNLIDEWRSIYVEFPAINRRVELAARRRGYIKLVDGRYRWFKPFEEYGKAFNAKIQGDIGQAMKHAMNAIDAEWPETLLLQVHDSLVTEVRSKSIAEAQSAVLARVATDLFNTEMESEVKPWI